MIRDASLTEILIMVPAMLMALTIHELCHGLSAYWLGDSTAKRDGRLSLNPIKHIDPIGLLLLLFVGFGWAKPVMVNPYNLKNPKVDMALISIAGPLSNFIMAFLGMMIFYAIFFFAPVTAFTIHAINAVRMFTFINIVLGVFNLLPIPPLDGSKVVAGLLPDSVYRSLPPVGMYGMIFLMILMFTGITGQVIFPIINAVFDAFASVALSFYSLFF